jgi:predicted dehydrogenase
VEVEDTISMSYRYRTGALGILEATTSLAGPVAYEQSIWGKEGQIALGSGLRFWSRHTVDGHESGRWHSARSLPRPAARRHFLEAFAQAVLDGKAPEVTAAEALSVQAAMEAAYLSAAERRLAVIPTPGEEPKLAPDGEDPK